MVNEDIVTVLRNAVNNGEPLQQAIQVLVNSGYDSQQVQEASRYVQGGAMQNLEPKKDEQLVMAQNKNIFGKRTSSQSNVGRNDSQQRPNPMLNQQRIQSQQHMQNAMLMNKQQVNRPGQVQSSSIGQKPITGNSVNKFSQPVPQQSMAMSREPIQQKAEQPPQIKLKKKSHTKEIILMIILLILIGILASTVFFREEILTLLSG